MARVPDLDDPDLDEPDLDEPGIHRPRASRNFVYLTRCPSAVTAWLPLG